jgi:hypothetical protein
LTERGLAQDHAGEESAKRQRHAKQLGGSKRHAERDCEDRKAEQLARSRMCDVVKDPRNDPPTHDQHKPDEYRHLDERQQQHARKSQSKADHERVRRERFAASAQEVGKNRKQDQNQHHRQIFDDQPADGEPAALGIHQMTFLNRTEQNDRAGDRQSEPEHDAGADGPPHEEREAEAHGGSDSDLDNGAGHSNRANRQKVLEREVQPNPEHQQDDAELGELAGQFLIRDEAGREGSDRHPREQIAHERRKAEPMSDCPKHEGEAEAADDRRDKGRLMEHASILSPLHRWTCPIGERALRAIVRQRVNLQLPLRGFTQGVAIAVGCIFVAVQLFDGA